MEQEHWHDQSPVAPSERESASALERKSPYSITVGYEKVYARGMLRLLGVDDAVSVRPYGVVVKLSSAIVILISVQNKVARHVKVKGMRI